MINKFQTKRDRKQQAGINQALKPWSRNHPMKQQALEIKRRPIPKPEVKPQFVPSTMCEIGLIIPLEMKR